MINLLPPDVKDSIHYGRLNVSLVQYTILLISVLASLIAVMLFGLGVVAANERGLKQNIADQQAVLNTYAEVTTQAKELERTINTINSLLDREVRFSVLLQEIGSVIPSGARLTGLSLTGDATQPLQINAALEAQSVAPILRQNLEDSDLFAQADIQSVGTNYDDNGRISGVTTIIVTSFEEGAIR